MAMKNILSYIFISFFILTVHLPIGAEDITAAPRISYSTLIQVVPGSGLPEGLDLRGSNNNLDIVRYHGRIYFAFRNAPTHFASRAARHIILSSADGEHWSLEKITSMGRDMREPRFLVYKDRLFYYFFSAGKNPWTFTPQHIWACEYLGPGKWTGPKIIWKPGYVVWRAKEHNGVALMSVYAATGVKETKGGTPSELSLLKSEDGLNWEPFNPDRPVQVYGAGEADFEFDAEGNLYTVVRNESGASKICKAPAADISDWKCVESPMKYDSPLMFKHGDEIYMIARRNIAGKYYHNSKAVPDGLESWVNMGRYWVTRKRTAMYRFNTAEMKIEWLFDFPSKGDTAFPAIIQLNEDQYLLYNYSSPIRGPDWCWLGGQLTGTRIYSTVITFGRK